MATQPDIPEIARLIDALRKEKIRFLIAGMSAGILQGVPLTTFDTDIWVDLPSRQYLRIHQLMRKLGGDPVAKTAGYLRDGSLINFLFQIDGLQSFSTEYKRCDKLSWNGRRIPVLPLRRLLKSKRFISRPKDIAHIPIIEETIRLKNETARVRPQPR